MNGHVKPASCGAIFVFAAISWFLGPQAIPEPAWHTLVIFIATILAIVFNALPIGGAGLLGITAFAVTDAAGAGSPKGAVMAALSGFDSTLIWLIIVAFFIAKGFIKTGFGKRIALVMVKFLGKHTLGLAFGLSIADLVLAPATPSNTARCGGVIYPIANALAQSFDSMPKDETRKKMGRFLITCIGNVNDITAVMFVTAYAANPLIMILAEGFGAELTWTGWFIAALGPAAVSLVSVPLVLYAVMTPEIKETPGARVFAGKELARMGPMGRNEWIMAGTFVLVLVLWIFGKEAGLHSTATALLGLSVLILTGVLTWDDIKGEKAAWDTLVWFSALLMMAGTLNTLGFTKWFGSEIGDRLAFMSGMHWILILVALNAVYTYVHYFFASGTAQVAALYGVFLGVGLKLGIPLYPLVLLLGFSSSLYCSLTQYTHARGPILFGAGYVTSAEWWRAGFMVNLLNQIIFATVGMLWWKLIGLY